MGFPGLLGSDVRVLCQIWKLQPPVPSTPGSTHMPPTPELSTGHRRSVWPRRPPPPAAVTPTLPASLSKSHFKYCILHLVLFSSSHFVPRTLVVIHRGPWCLTTAALTLRLASVNHHFPLGRACHPGPSSSCGWGLYLGIKDVEVGTWVAREERADVSVVTAHTAASPCHLLSLASSLVPPAHSSLDRRYSPCSLRAHRSPRAWAGGTSSPPLTKPSRNLSLGHPASVSSRGTPPLPWGVPGHGSPVISARPRVGKGWPARNGVGPQQHCGHCRGTIRPSVWRRPTQHLHITSPVCTGPSLRARKQAWARVPG